MCFHSKLNKVTHSMHKLYYFRTMKKIIILCLLSFTFSACGELTQSSEKTSSPPARADASPQAAQTLVTWKTVTLTGGEKDLYIVVNGRDYYLKNVKWFHKTATSEFTQMGIPRSAAAAGSFSESSEEEASQGIYAADVGSGVNVFTAYYMPGAMHDVNWSILKVINH